MRVKIYRYDTAVTRSILRASCVAEVETDEPPGDLDEFAEQHGGDFIEFDNED